MRAATPGVCPTPHATVSLLLSPSLSYHSLSASTFVSSSAYFSGSHLFLCIFLFVSVSFSPCVSLELSIFLGFSPFLFPHSLSCLFIVYVFPLAVKDLDTEKYFHLVSARPPALRPPAPHWAWIWLPATLGLWGECSGPWERMGVGEQG